MTHIEIDVQVQRNISQDNATDTTERMKFTLQDSSLGSLIESLKQAKDASNKFLTKVVDEEKASVQLLKEESEISEASDEEISQDDPNKRLKLDTPQT